jgi:hypothetical protein
MSNIVEQFDNMVGHIISVNDERDVTLLLLGLRDMWPKVRIEIERLRADIKKLNHELDLLEEKSRHD